MLDIHRGTDHFHWGHRRADRRRLPSWRGPSTRVSHFVRLGASFSTGADWQHRVSFQSRLGVVHGHRRGVVGRSRVAGDFRTTLCQMDGRRISDRLGIERARVGSSRRSGSLRASDVLSGHRFLGDHSGGSHTFRLAWGGRPAGLRDDSPSAFVVLDARRRVPLVEIETSVGRRMEMVAGIGGVGMDVVYFSAASGIVVSGNGLGPSYGFGRGIESCVQKSVWPDSGSCQGSGLVRQADRMVCRVVERSMALVELGHSRMGMVAAEADRAPASMGIFMVIRNDQRGLDHRLKPSGRANGQLS